eukprot:9482267-Pyramimonas_sp.AAC.1
MLETGAVHALALLAEAVRRLDNFEAFFRAPQKQRAFRTCRVPSDLRGRRIRPYTVPSGIWLRHALEVCGIMRLVRAHSERSLD